MIHHEPALRERIARNLAAHQLHEAPHDGNKRAAVAIVVLPSELGSDPYDPQEIPRESLRVIPGDISGLDGKMVDVAGGASFLLCRRAAKLNNHGGQWALPGGRMDPGETPEDTARRELHEELGLDLGAEAVIGRLDDYVTRSGYVMTPVVLWAGGEVVLRPDPAEVAHVYRIGLHHLQREDSPRFITIPESDRPVVQLPLGGDLIHAPTGAVLVQFRWVALDGRADERVHEFEQPVFAWK
ncbi:MAG: CoA pyrophosphatase [Actinomycetota bacterium]|nr:CoA pyrophosphatase [Actinomycetota bacterium]